MKKEDKKEGKVVSIQDDWEQFDYSDKLSPIFVVAKEVMTEVTKPLLHKFSRFWYIVKGKAIFRIQGNIVEVSQGQLVGILPWQCTEVLAVSEPLEYYIIVYEYDVINSLIKDAIYTLNGKFDYSGQIYSNIFVDLDEKESEDVERIILEMMKEVELKGSREDSSESNFIMSHLMIQLIIVYYKAAMKHQKKNDKKKLLGNNIEMFHYIYFNLNKKLSLKKLSERFYMSESAVSKYIFDTIGVTYSQLIATMKIARLMNSLHYSENTLQELAILLGFVDAAHLSNYFKSKTGLSTREYKESICSTKILTSGYRINIMQSIVQYILNNYSSNLTIQIIGKEFNIPTHNINEVFEYYLGKDFHTFINYVRIIKSSELLLSTSKSISNIAFEVGFNTVRTYNRNFSRYFNISPTEFRKKIDFQASPL